MVRMTSVLLACVAVASGFAQKSKEPVAAGPKIRVAVIDLEFRQGVYNGASQVPADFKTGLLEKISQALNKTGRFVVLERQMLEEIRQERDIARDAGQGKPAIQPAQLLIKAEITEFTVAEQGAGVGIDVKGIGRLHPTVANAMVKINLRAVDPYTSEVVASKDGQGRASTTDVRFRASVSAVLSSFEVFKSSPLGHATTKAIDDAVKGLASGLGTMPWSAKVIDVDKSGVYVNSGEKDGLRVGDTLEVVRPKKVVRDPETGEVLGQEQERVGVLRVTELRARYSITVVTFGDTPQVGDTVRLLKDKDLHRGD